MASETLKWIVLICIAQKIHTVRYKHLFNKILGIKMTNDLNQDYKIPFLTFKPLTHDHWRNYCQISFIEAFGWEENWLIGRNSSPLDWHICPPYYDIKRLKGPYNGSLASLWHTSLADSQSLHLRPVQGQPLNPSKTNPSQRSRCRTARLCERPRGPTRELTRACSDALSSLGSHSSC